MKNSVKVMTGKCRTNSALFAVLHTPPGVTTLVPRPVQCRHWRLSPNLATVAEFGDKLSPFPATTVSSVDRA